MTGTAQHVLVLDAKQRSALAVTRSLGQIPGLKISTADSSLTSLAGSSKFSYQYFVHPAPQDEPQAFLDWMQQTIKTEQIDVLFPVTDLTSQMLLMHQDILGACLLPFASYDTLIALADKVKLTELAQTLDIRVPTSRMYKNKAEVDINDISHYPVVVKPCLSQIRTGSKWIETLVVVAHSQEELRTILERHTYLRHYAFMIQEYISGHGAGIFAIYDHGEPVAYFAHRRIRELPPEGGMSVLSESVGIAPELKRVAERLLVSATWHGVAMVEFRVDERGTPYLLEVNTRFWGSLQLAIDASIDFPKLLWQITTGQPVTSVENYRIGQRLRWFLGDLDSLILTFKSRNDSVGQKIKHLITFVMPRFAGQRHEVNRFGDFRPAWTELKQYVSR